MKGIPKGLLIPGMKIAHKVTVGMDLYDSKGNSLGYVRRLTKNLIFCDSKSGFVGPPPNSLCPVIGGMITPKKHNRADFPHLFYYDSSGESDLQLIIDLFKQPKGE